MIWRASTCRRQGPTAYGVRWDLAHQRALVITNRGSGGGPAHDYWLVDFGLGDLVVKLAIVVAVSLLAALLSGTAAAQSATATFDAPATTAIDSARIRTTPPRRRQARIQPHPHRPPVRLVMRAVRPSRR